MTVLSSSPVRLISMSAAFEQIVLASRLNSCARNSNLRPTGWSLLEQLVRRRDMRAQAVELLLDIGLGGKQQSFLVQPLGIEAGAWLDEPGDLLAKPRGDRLRAAARQRSRRARSGFAIAASCFSITV